MKLSSSDNDVELTARGTIKIKKLTTARRWLYATLVFLIIITTYGLITLDNDDLVLKTALKDFANCFISMFFQAHSGNRFTVMELLHALGFTLVLSALTTIIGTFFALILAIGAARTITPKKLSIIIKGCMSIIRAVPTIIWVLIFSVAANIGTDAAVIGMTFHTTAYLVKGFSESFEEIDRATIEALQSCGAGLLEIITQAILPASMTSIISWIFFRFEINFINAVAVGAAAGAGGIGYHLFMAGNIYFDIREVGAITYFIFILAVGMEYCSIHIRKKMSR